MKKLSRGLPRKVCILRKTHHMQRLTASGGTGERRIRTTGPPHGQVCKSGQATAWKLEHIPRGSNEKASALAVVVASLLIRETMFLPVYYQPASSITTNQMSQIDEESFSWLTHIMHYLSSGGLPDNRIEAHKIQVQAARLSLVNGKLYKRSLDGPYLKCLTTQ